MHGRKSEHSVRSSREQQPSCPKRGQLQSHLQLPTHDNSKVCCRHSTALVQCAVHCAMVVLSCICMSNRNSDGILALRPPCAFNGGGPSRGGSASATHATAHTHESAAATADTASSKATHNRDAIAATVTVKKGITLHTTRMTAHTRQHS